MTATTGQERTRTVVLLRKDVAPTRWHEKFSVLVAEAESGADGVEVAQQRMNKEGSPIDKWWEGDPPVHREIAPKDWAAYWGDHNDKTWLHFQNYTLRPEAWMAYAEVKR